VVAGQERLLPIRLNPDFVLGVLGQLVQATNVQLEFATLCELFHVGSYPYNSNTGSVALSPHQMLVSSTLRNVEHSDLNQPQNIYSSDRSIKKFMFAPIYSASLVKNTLVSSSV